MADGRIVQEGPAEEIYASPFGPFVANFVGKTNLVGGTVSSVSGAGPSRWVRVETEIGIIEARAGSGVTANAGDSVMVAIRPENILLEPTNGPHRGVRLSGSVEAVVYLGNMVDCVVAIGSAHVRVQLHPSQKPSRGAKLELFLPAEHCLTMPRGDATG
jgi:iron(III) transport system ATP-binding protein